jgi:hypothetical protein
MSQVINTGGMAASETARTPGTTPADEAAAEQLRLWADYYEAAAHVLEIVRSGGSVTDAALVRILAGHSRATRALKRIKELRGIRD